MTLPGMTSTPCALFFRSVFPGELGYVAPHERARVRVYIGTVIERAWRDERARAAPSVWMGPAGSRFPSHIGRLEGVTVGLRDGQP